MSRFFIDRPIFAWVIAIVLMLAGGLAIRSLSIAQYPDIAPPAVQITAIYPGADAQTLENTTTQVIEQQMKGLDHLRYFGSTSDSSGTVTITLTFDQGTNPDIAQVQVQNKLQLATPLLPQEVQQQGLSVAKAVKNFLLIVAVYSNDDSHSQTDLGDYVASTLQDPISRLTGVGDITLFGSQFAMRVWLDPYKLTSYNLTVTDVSNAISAQNAQVSAGQIGGLPALPGQALNVTVQAQSRLHTADEFRNIVLRVNPDGSTVHLADVARVQIGAETYGFQQSYNGHNTAGFGVKLAPGANALNTVEAIKAEIGKLQNKFPSDIRIAYPLDATPFVRLSIEEVTKTLAEAIVLVFLVMFLFLQNWRATLIPTITVPVVLLGTFAILLAAGYTINTLTLFGMVLAIGLLVDDAIVVVENCERLIVTEKLEPREAARRSMDEISGALIGIGLVLTAVFLPMAFFGGSTGVIYRQFAITIVSAMVLSVMVALILTPALCATFLRPAAEEHEHQRGFFGWFNRTFDRGITRYDSALGRVERRWGVTMLIYVLICGGLALLFVRLPSGFLPDEDQGLIFNLVSTPAGTPAEQTGHVMDQVRDFYLKDEAKNVEGIYIINGFSFAGQGQNVAIAFARLKSWDDRDGKNGALPAIIGRAMGKFGGITAGQVFAVQPPPVLELGNATGFDFELKDEGGIGHDRLMAARNQLLGMAGQDHRLVQVRPNGLDDTPQLKIDVDNQRAAALGLSQAEVNATLSAFFGSSYVNQFVDRGRVKRVFLQGDAKFRSSPSDIDRLYVRGASGTMAPFSAFSTARWLTGPTRLERYNGLPALEIQGGTAPGTSTGTAIKAMQELARKLPAGTGYEWTGLSYEEQLAGGQASALYILSLLIVFLCLAALYESWSVPLAVILVVPLGIVGALLAATLTGLSNDIYLQVGLITTVGVSAKNAILIVEFAEEQMRAGKRAAEAAREAAKLRLRPILMTSIAFVFGVAPLAISTGAGAGGQNAIGRSVVGGMLSATIFAIFFVPVFFTVVKKLFRQDRPGGGAERGSLNEDVKAGGKTGPEGSDANAGSVGSGPAPQGA